MQTDKKWGKLKKPVKERGFVIENKKKIVTISACVPEGHQSGTLPRSYLSSSGRVR